MQWPDVKSMLKQRTGCHSTDECDISRGFFAGEVGVPRLLRLFQRKGINITWFISGHSIESSTTSSGPDNVRRMQRPEASCAQAGVFTSLTSERGRGEAEASVKRHAAGKALGPLDGVRVSRKDLFDVAGAPTTCGSRLTSRVPAARDAELVSRLSAAGAICIGPT